MSDIAIRHYFGRVHIVDNDLNGLEQHSHGSDKWVTILVRIDPFERTIRRDPLCEYRVMNGLSFFPKDTRDLHE